MPEPDCFTCDACGGTFEKGWTDAEARAEADALGFDGPYGTLCDDCHVEFMAWARRKGLVR